MDEAVALHLLQGPDARTGEVVWQGQTHPGYANMVGPYGGVTAAQALQSVLQHPQLLGVPVALTINYAAALAYGEFTIRTRPARTNRSTQHWLIEIMQNDEAGQPQIVITGTAMTAARRDTYGSVDHPLPAVAGADACETRRVKNPLEWLNRYDQRIVDGDFHSAWDSSEHDSQSTVWMRDEPARPLDFVGLTGLADVFYPRIWRRRALRVPAGTVSMTRTAVSLAAAVNASAMAAYMPAVNEFFLSGRWMVRVHTPASACTRMSCVMGVFIPCSRRVGAWWPAPRHRAPTAWRPDRNSH